MNNFRLLIAGISGYGKSYFFKNTILKNVVKKQPVIIFDRTGEYLKGIDLKSSIKRKNYDSFLDFLIHLTANAIENKVYVVKCSKDEDYIVGLRTIKEYLTNCCIVIDESHDIFLSKELYPAKSELIKIARYGRHKGNSLILISQRSKDIPPNVRSQCTGIISFFQNEKADIQTLVEKGLSNSGKVSELKKGEYLIAGIVPKFLFD